MSCRISRSLGSPCRIRSFSSLTIPLCASSLTNELFCFFATWCSDVTIFMNNLINPFFCLLRNAVVVSFCLCAKSLPLYSLLDVSMKRMISAEEKTFIQSSGAEIFGGILWTLPSRFSGIPLCSCRRSETCRGRGRFGSNRRGWTRGEDICENKFKKKTKKKQKNILILAFFRLIPHCVSAGLGTELEITGAILFMFSTVEIALRKCRIFRKIMLLFQQYVFTSVQSGEEVALMSAFAADFTVMNAWFIVVKVAVQYVAPGEYQISTFFTNTFNTF